MASGDRIELLTAGTFETAMDAQETILNNVSTNVNTINTNVTQSLQDISTAYTNISKDIATVYQTEATNYGILADLSNKVGSSNNTGGTATAGSIMAKLNTLINGVTNIQSSSSNSLYSTIFIPSDSNILKTVLNTPVTISASASFLGAFIAKYSGQIRVAVSAYSTSTSTSYTGSLEMGINYVGGNENLMYPSMNIAHKQYYNGSSFEKTASIRVAGTSLSTSYKYINLKAGDIIYFYGYAPVAAESSTFTNITIYGSTISYY